MIIIISKKLNQSVLVFLLLLNLIFKMPQKATGAPWSDGGVGGLEQ